ncbi:MinD/ParA family protein [Pelomonas aquatica]|jgi:flagellar biosynthesis protein FlhG|uniref:MinD/ParA family protein n=1 Tax=Pelomonas aquatica TaxID=431058 RepID=A0A9X4LJ86_9BURK|nr:MinD/ParA family protein [Pelomonas aquatica]MCY4754807.1 MinD/ParA family protein [Pelomonas aquatica]MDG0861880.1 MinD/ParA family protein [Pelomonas aquatica]
MSTTSDPAASASSPAQPAQPPRPARSGAHTLAVTSGKGGVGKTFVTANLAAALAARGQKVLVLDADLGLANLDVVLNLHPKLTLHDVFTEKATLEQAILPAPGGFSVLLAGSGMVEYSRLTPEVRDKLLHIIDLVKPRFDWVLLDTGAGISDVVLYAISLATDVLVVATPEPTSLTDAYATIKVLATQQERRQVGLLVNQANRVGEGKLICGQLQQVLQRFVGPVPGQGFRLELLAEVKADPAVKQAVLKRQLMLEHYPGCDAAQAIKALASKLLG